MLMSELAGKEIVDLSEGVRLGPVRDAELLLDPASGRVAALVLPVRRGWLSRGELVVPWHRVLKVGPDVIIVDLRRGQADNGIRRPWEETLKASRVSPGGRESVGDGNGHWRV